MKKFAFSFLILIICFSSSLLPCEIKQKVLLIGSGLSGVGKTTILKQLNSKLLNSCYFSKNLLNDTLLQEKKELPDRYNRDYYKKYVAKQSYDIMLDLAIDNLKDSNRVVILDGYFGDKIGNPMFKKLFDLENVNVKIIYFQCSFEIEKSRLRKRDELRDREKLLVFDQYHQEHLKSHNDTLSNFECLIINTEEDMDENIDKIITYISS
jgi:predicted kinase